MIHERVVSREDIGKEISNVGRHHVERAARVAFRHRLEIGGLQGPTRGIDGTGVGHVHDEPHGGTGQSVCRA